MQTPMSGANHRLEHPFEYAGFVGETFIKVIYERKRFSVCFEELFCYTQYTTLPAGCPHIMR